MAARIAFGSRSSAAEFTALCRRVFRSWIGQGTLRGCTIFHVLNLRRNVLEIGGSSLLFSPASNQHHIVCIYHAAFDGAGTLARWGGMARD